jgi:hypothetical protein
MKTYNRHWPGGSTQARPSHRFFSRVTCYQDEGMEAYKHFHARPAVPRPRSSFTRQTEPAMALVPAKVGAPLGPNPDRNLYRKIFSQRLACTGEITDEVRPRPQRSPLAATTQRYDRRGDSVTLDDVERVAT